MVCLWIRGESSTRRMAFRVADSRAEDVEHLRVRERHHQERVRLVRAGQIPVARPRPEEHHARRRRALPEPEDGCPDIHVREPPRQNDHLGQELTEPSQHLGPGLQRDQRVLQREERPAEELREERLVRHDEDVHAPSLSPRSF